MTNELRKTLGRNMRYAQMNDNIDNQISKLQAQSAYDFNAKNAIDMLQQQRDENIRQMNQPMSAAEYEQYDDYGNYIGDETKPNNGVGQMVADGVNHLAQGASLGWSDEMMGVIGGTGQVLANGAWRAMGHSTNGEGFRDAWNNGYREYRDYARQELQDGYQRNPTISAGAEVVGAVASPIKPFKARGYTGSLGKIISHPEDIARARWMNSIGTSVVNGAGYTNQNTPGEYAKNIAMSVGTNAVGTAGGNKLFGSGNNMYRVGRGTMNGISASVPYTYDLYQRKKNGW